MREINNFQQELDGTLYQAWEQFNELLIKCPQHYLTEMQEVILFYNRLEVLTRQILDSKGAIPSKTVADAKVAIQEMEKYSQKWLNETSRTRRCKNVKDPTTPNISHSKKKGNPRRSLLYSIWCTFPKRGYRAAAPGFYQRNNANPSYQERRQSMKETLSKFMRKSTKRHEENSNIVKQIRASTDATIENQGALIKTLEIQIKKMSKNNKLINKTRQMTISFPIPLNDYYCEEEKGNVRFDNALAVLGASVSVMPPSTYLNLVLGKLAHTKLTVELADKTVKYPKGIAENVLLVLTDFTVLEDMDTYRDEGMGDVIFGEPFLREVGINERWFEWMITIFTGNEEITYQMMWSHPRFKRHTNEQCKKIPPLLKVIIMEYLVKISKKARIRELKRGDLKITVLITNTSYPSRKIRRIRAYTSQKTTKETKSYPGKTNTPNLSYKM
nr:hypothetical protein [Tanacetum cinerariifolium]